MIIFTTLGKNWRNFCKCAIEILQLIDIFSEILKQVTFKSCVSLFGHICFSH